MVSTQILFGRINIKFGFVDCVDDYIVITVHPEWNLIFFAGENRIIIAYDMDRIKVHVISTQVFWYGIRSVKKEFICRPYYLSYVLLFLDSLESSK
jgi:hypothetical protein